MSRFFERAFVRGGETARLVEKDPELFEGLPAHARRQALASVVVPVLELQRGAWPGDVPGLSTSSGSLGLLVLEGTMIRNVRVGRQPRSELIGQGDLARPWEHDGETASMPFGTDWRVLEPTRLAILDARFLAVACRWPVVISAIIGRAVRRAHWLALQLAISDVRHIKPRLLLLFWHLADRWGRVGRDGVTIPLCLTHEVIAQLVGAQRPTVSTALQALSREGLLTRLPDRTWLLDPRSANLAEQGLMLLSTRNGAPGSAGATPPRTASPPPSRRARRLPTTATSAAPAHRSS
jgi:CRP/FNR family transcriptional regulator, cyclic AMP receptor protein